MGLDSICIECILDCNDANRVDTDQRLTDYLNGDTKCRLSKTPGGVTTCRIGNMGIDFARTDIISRNFVSCLDFCSEVCENGSDCEK